MQKNLTDIVIKRTKPPVTGHTEIWDTDVRGLGVRISAKGSRTYFIMYRIGEGEARRQRRMSIGEVTDIGLDDARDKARDVKRAVKKGVDPQVKMEPPAPPKRVTVRDAFEQYMALHVKPNLGARTGAGLRGMFDVDVLPHVGNRPIDEIKKIDVVALHNAVVARGAPVGANRLHASLRAFFNWTVTNGILDDSPAAGTKPPTKEIERERALTEDEIGWFWKATEKMGPFGDLFRLLLVTAQRRDEVREMRRPEVDIDKRTWTIPAARAKNGKKHEVALSDLAVAILERRKGAEDLIFASERARPRNRGNTAISGLSRAKRRLDAAMAEAAGSAVEPFTLHDLRRTAATQMAELGIAPHVVDKLLNHQSGTIKGVAAIYNRHEYRSEQREALLKWARRLSAIVGVGDDAVVVNLPGRGRA